MTFKSAMATVEAAAQIARRQRAVTAEGEAYGRRGMFCLVEVRGDCACGETHWQPAIVERVRVGKVELVRLADRRKLGRELFGRVMLDTKGQVAHPVLLLARLLPVFSGQRMDYAAATAVCRAAVRGEGA